MKDIMKKDNVIEYLKELGKELKKYYGKNSNFEIIITGGASIILNYDFEGRDSTGDIDYFKAKGNPSIMTCINNVQDKFNLGDKWMNEDVYTSNSYSNELRLHSKYFKTFSNVLRIYTIKDEYLIAMKLIAFRNRDILDIKRIYYECNINKTNIYKAL